MAAHRDAMRINTVYSAGYVAQPGVTESVKNIGPTWGSWKTWQACDTDNVICHDLGRARELCNRAMQAVCNLYLPQQFYQSTARPVGVQFYQGEFQEDTLDIEDVVAMHLVVPVSDLVLLMGFDLTRPAVMPDRLQQHRIRNRLGLIRSCISTNPDTQWVLIDHAPAPDDAFADLTNLTRDSWENVLQLLT